MKVDIMFKTVQTITSKLTGSCSCCWWLISSFFFLFSRILSSPSEVLLPLHLCSFHWKFQRFWELLLQCPYSCTESGYNGPWKWTDGRFFDKNDRDWESYHPNLTGQACLVLTGGRGQTGQYSDFDCDLDAKVICEKPDNSDWHNDPYIKFSFNDNRIFIHWCTLTK